MCLRLSAVRGSPCREDYFGDLADVIFVGEAEETWPQFLNEWERRVGNRGMSKQQRPT